MEPLHALRRRLRQLRYAREWLEETPEDLVLMQSAFGSVNDLATTARLLEACPGAPKISEWSADIARRLEESKTRALGLWIQHRPRVEDVA
jgi:hypothetical protein